MSRLDNWKQWATHLKREIYALYLAYQDPRTPRYARIFIALVVGYAFSPIDLIPDFIPILGYLDDLILLPLGIVVALRMIPADVMKDCREQAQNSLQSNRPVNRFAAWIIMGIWILLALLGLVMIRKILL
jgi:uncharacterized membrane protein YkvA (DUF1232 family)